MKPTKFQNYYRKHREIRKKASSAYFKTERGKEVQHLYNIKNKENRRLYRLKNKDKLRNYNKEYSKRLRSAAIDTLGGKCVSCGVEDIRVLQIDHINGGGSLERKSREYVGNFYKNVIRSFLNKENKYQILCANCNWIKRSENEETKKR